MRLLIGYELMTVPPCRVRADQPLLLVVTLAVFNSHLSCTSGKLPLVQRHKVSLAAMTNGDLLRGKRAERVLHQSIAAPALRSTHARIDREGQYRSQRWI